MARVDVHAERDPCPESDARVGEILARADTDATRERAQAGKEAFDVMRRSGV